MGILEVKNLQYYYEDKKNVLQDINAQMEQGRMYVIFGPSGCGEPTLTSLLGGLHNPSDGQQQRVAIARALASDAQVILADEPTGNLDEATAAEITAILKESAHKSGKCVVIVTHSNELAKEADRIFRLRRGELHTVEVHEIKKGKAAKKHPTGNVV